MKSFKNFVLCLALFCVSSINLNAEMVPNRGELFFEEIDCDRALLMEEIGNAASKCFDKLYESDEYIKTVIDTAKSRDTRLI
jgi:hypothetical protein